MIPADLISSSEAAQIAKIAESTLRRFAEAGYLHPRKNLDGGELFSRKEVAQLFGLSLPDQVEVVQERQTPPPLSWDDDLEGSDEGEFEDSEPKIITASATPQIQPQTPNAQAFEISRLQTLTELQERLIEVQALQITQLQSERDWLRERVERLEAKSDRDQGLILSKTQTIERLVSVMSQRRSAFGALLEWFGFSQPNTQPFQLIAQSETVEIHK